MTYLLNTRIINKPVEINIEDDNFENMYDSNIIETSCCLKINNITGTFDILSRNIRTNTRNIFRELLSGINDFISDVLIERYEEHINAYAKACLSARMADVTRFMHDWKTGEINNYFKAQYNTGKTHNFKKDKPKNIPEKNIILTFNNEKFKALTGMATGWDSYATLCRHLFVLALVVRTFELANIDLSLMNIDFYQRLYEKVKLSLLSGMKADCEFILEGSYGELFEEITQLTPLRRNEMNFTVDKEKQIFEITLKDSAFLSRAYGAFVKSKWTKEDIGKTIKIAAINGSYRIKTDDVRVYEHDDYLDTKDLSKVRIAKGSTMDSMRVRVELSGKRIISRLHKINSLASENVLADFLYEHYCAPDDMIANLLWRILWRTRQWQRDIEIQRSFYSVYADYIKNYDGKRNIAKKTAIVILLSQKTADEREKLINKYFDKNATQQKAEIRAELDKLDKLIEEAKPDNSAITKFIVGLENRVW
ncbi:MAG: hypothetical protein NC200_00835 [Candidatus Gastranaerophilales bacterium]|nr:hypothetical protein [Candidatus Gastranaerophilales bacterium]